jgi:hypothetical protein
MIAQVRVVEATDGPLLVGNSSDTILTYGRVVSQLASDSYEHTAGLDSARHKG